MVCLNINMAIDHIEMALVYRYVNRLTDRATRVMKTGT